MMKGINWMLSTQLILAISALCLSLETFILTGYNLQPEPVFGLIFFGSLCLYNLAFLGSFPFTVASLKKKKGKAILFILSFAGSTFCLYFLPLNTCILVLCSALLCVLYLYKIKWHGLLLFVRNVPLLKNILLSWIWAWVTVWIPLSVYQEGFTFPEGTTVIFLRRFFFILAIAIPYDIRDYWSDLKNNLHTLPVTMGIWKSKLVALLSLSLFGLFVMWNSFFGNGETAQVKQVSFAFFISAFLTGAIILLAHAERKKIYFSLWLDGMMILQFVLLLLTLKSAHANIL